MNKIKIIKREPIPQILIENLLEIHPAIDPDTGHFICHYKGIQLATIKVEDQEFPALQIGDYMVIIPGKEIINKIKQIFKEYKTNTIPPLQNINKNDLASVLSIIGTIDNIKLYTDDKNLAITIEDKYYAAIILTTCKKDEDKHTILQV